MASQYGGVHLPRGYEFAVQTDPEVPNVYTDLGVTYDDGGIEWSYDKTEWTGSQAESILTFINNMQITVTATLAQIEMSNFHKLMSGATNYVSVAGTLVEDASQVVASGGWAYNKFIKIEHQNGNGGAITVNSVTGGTDGLLVAETDYFVGRNDTGEYGIFIIDSATVTTLSQTMTIVYDYTPSASRSITAGDSSVEVTPRAIRLRKNLGTTGSPKYFTVYIYSATNDAGLSLNFPRWDATDPVTVPITMTGKIDTSRSSLDQLFSIVDEYTVTDL